MKLKRLFFAMALLAGFGLAITSCKEDDDNNTTAKPNQMTYKGATYALDKVAVMKYFKKAEGFNYTLVFLSPGGAFHTTGDLLDSLGGTGQGIAFDIYSSDSSGISAGNYAYDTTWSAEAGTMDMASMVYNYNFATDEGDNVDFEAGTLVVNKNGSTYEFTYSANDASGSPMTFYYSGTLKYYEDGMKSKNIWIQ